MLPFLPLLILLLSFLAGSAQTVVSGKVKDGKGRPVQGASITIKDTYDGATTDSLGITVTRPEGGRLAGLRSAFSGSGF